MLIQNKKHFYELASKGLCGNTPRTWNSVDEYWPFRNEYPFAGIRGMKYGQLKGAAPRMPSFLVRNHIHFHGLKIGEYVISAVPMVDVGPGLQGELGWSTLRGEWDLFCAEERGYQRRVLAEKGRRLSGLAVIWKLKEWLDAPDYEDLMELFEIYSEGTNHPVIEFAQTDRIGINPNRSMLIWEIRHH